MYPGMLMLCGVVLAVNSPVIGQADTSTQRAVKSSQQAATSVQRTERPTPPARDPHTAGYVAATELPDGSLPSAKEDGNFIIGPTHNPAPELASINKPLQGTVVEFTMNSADSKIYPGIAREPNTFGTPDPSNPAKLRVTIMQEISNWLYPPSLSAVLWAICSIHTSLRCCVTPPTVTRAASPGE